MILQTETLSRWYGQVIAINDVTLSIPKGITGLLGQNGAGKTSLMRVAAGLLRPSSGSCRIFGEDPWNNPHLALRIGYSPEHDGLYEFMTGREFVRTLLKLRGRPPAEATRRSDEALERVGLQNQADRRLSTYSRGMRQRLKIAQAVAHDPEFIILDEPMSGSDPIIRQQLTALIREFVREGKHVLVSSHILHEVEQLTSHVVLIHRGRLVADGDIHEIRSMIDRYPHSIHVRATRTRELAAALAGEPGISEMIFGDDGSLTLRTRIPDAFYSRFPQLALEVGSEVSELSSPDDNLESVYRYLTER